MKVAILDGGAQSVSAHDVDYSRYLGDLVRTMRARGHEVEHIRLGELDLRPCTGCWSCWIRTPGRCPQRDDCAEVTRTYLRSDLVLFATPLRLGFVSALTKVLLDRLVPLFLPQIVLHAGEFVHADRYARYPRVGCVLHRGAYDEDDLRITRALFERYAFHFKSELAVAASTDMPVAEVCDAIDGLQRVTADEARQHRAVVG